MTPDYSRYRALEFARPRPRILEVILSAPDKLNALDADGHRELAEIGRDIDRDPEVSVVLPRGDNGTFSTGGDLGLIEEMADDFAMLSAPDHGFVSCSGRKNARFGCHG